MSLSDSSACEPSAPPPGRPRAKRVLAVLGNCVAQRLASLLSAIPQVADEWDVLSLPPVHNAGSAEELARIARAASQCDLVFSQPLFNFGPCNTEILKESLTSRLHVFSAPNFEAYFPDVLDIRPLPVQESFPAPLEWHSRIFIQCKAANVPVTDVEKIYVNHPLFRERAVSEALEKSLALYERREQGVDIGTLDEVRSSCLYEPLFFTWNHPGDRLLRKILSGMLAALPLGATEIQAALASVPWTDNHQTGAWSEWGFGFNSWPIITRQHKLFSFKGRDGFRVAGMDVDITTCAIAYYGYYDAHPEIFARALALCSR